MSEQAEQSERVRIWSGEHRAWWRPNGCGYTNEVAQAGIYDREDAVSRTHHCGPEKEIQLQAVAAEQSGAPVRVWLNPRDPYGAWALTPKDACPGDVEFINASVVRELVEALEECAAGLMEEVRAQYFDTKTGLLLHPSYQRKYLRDVEPVVRARAALARIRGGTDEG